MGFFKRIHTALRGHAPTCPGCGLKMYAPTCTCGFALDLDQFRKRCLSVWRALDKPPKKMAYGGGRRGGQAPVAREAPLTRRPRFK